MQVIETVADFRAVERTCPRPLGSVPTMGYLHEGHLSLVRRSRSDNATAAASIFVNPTQFAENEDLSTYPRDMEGDLEKLRREGVDLVFAPSASEIYPARLRHQHRRRNHRPRAGGRASPRTLRRCGDRRLQAADHSQTGQRLFRTEGRPAVPGGQASERRSDLGANVVVMPTVRDPDGLALSSRNAYLSPEDRQSALSLSRALRLAETLCAEGVRDTATIRSQMMMVLNTEPVASIDYVSIADAETLEELTTIDRPALVSLAVRVGSSVSC